MNESVMNSHKNVEMSSPEKVKWNSASELEPIYIPYEPLSEKSNQYPKTEYPKTEYPDANKTQDFQQPKLDKMYVHESDFDPLHLPLEDSVKLNADIIMLT
jgi:hypothetical protein